MLTDVQLRKLKPRDRLYRIADRDGLCIEVTPSGARHWRYRYRFAGKAKMLALGAYPEIPLSQARMACNQTRAKLHAGVDPGEARKLDKLAALAAVANTFEAVMREWLDKQTQLSQATLGKAQWMLETMVLPWLGKRPIKDITAQELLLVLRRVEERGTLETAQRLKQRCGQIFRYAIATGRADRDPAADLRGAMRTPRTRHHASITDPREIGELLRAIYGHRGSFVTACALKLAPLFFVRPGELRKAEWTEFDLDAAEWRIPGHKMKMGEQHIVPVASQAMAILRELHPLTGGGRYVFPGVRTPQRPMSENTVNAALRRLGYANDQMTGHGFRSLASTRLHEMGWRSDVIERQLAHGERNKVKAAYNFAEYLPERRKMMQAWADYLDALREGRKMVTEGSKRPRNQLPLEYSR
ncbi:MAG: tyrosine-type recombinase/integrase [Nevskia sp.]|nr:tyrosine-type recombinase/integrase [Nevskia sp.]